MSTADHLSPSRETSPSADELVRVLEELTASCDHDVVLWRGAGLGGRDVDVLIDAADLRHAAGVLLRHRIVPTDARKPWGAWAPVGGVVPPIDLLGRHRWPARYQPLPGVLERVVRRGPVPVVAPEDLLLVLASDILAGRDLAKVRSRVTEIVASDPAARTRAERLAAAEGLGALCRAITEPVLAQGDRSGRLRLLVACRIALSSPPGRRALRDRLLRRPWRRLERLASTTVAAVTGSGRRPFLIAVSGMDGSGKTTLAATLHQHLVGKGQPAESSWARLGNETRILELVGQPIKRLLRRTGTIADPVVTAGPRVGKQQDPRSAAGRRGPVEWVWILLVSLVAARTQRRRTHPRRNGRHVVCDRWTVDALVDLELRYGPHRVAATAIKLLSPRPDLAVVLEVDADVAATRKPDDKSPGTLRDMQSTYAVRARDLSLICLDASLPEHEVAAHGRLLVDSLERAASTSTRTASAASGVGRERAEGSSIRSPGAPHS